MTTKKLIDCSKSNHHPRKNPQNQPQSELGDFLVLACETVEGYDYRNAEEDDDREGEGLFVYVVGHGITAILGT